MVIEASQPTASEYADLLQSAWSQTGKANWHVFSAGELIVVQRWQQLSLPAKHLFARLIFRVPGARVWHNLGHPEQIGHEICSASLGQWSHQLLPLNELITYFTKSELKAILTKHGAPVSGNKSELQQRAVSYHADIRETPRFSLRHRSLFNRLLRLHLGRTRRWTEAWELQQLGKRTYWTGPRSSAASLYFNRRQMLSAERAWRFEVCEPCGTSVDWKEALQAFAMESNAPNHRLSAANSWRNAIRKRLANKSFPAETMPLEQMLDAISTHEPAAVASMLPRLVNRLVTANACFRGLSLAASFDPLLPLDAQISNRAMHKRIARQLGVPSLPPMILQRPAIRRLRLPQAVKPSRDARPHYQVGHSTVPTEKAVMETLQAFGRVVWFTENLLWQHLFSALFADILMKPVPGMLTAPSTSQPLDFGLSAFYDRRKNEINQRLNQINAGNGSKIIRQNMQIFDGTRMARVTLGAWPEHGLTAICDFLPSSFLEQCFRHLATQSSPSFKGFPDLLLFPDSRTKPQTSPLPNAIPSTLPRDHLWIEVKGPNDRVQPAQQAWHHRFLSWKEPIEIWELRPSLVTQSK